MGGSSSPQYEVPCCLHPLLSALAPGPRAARELQLARARMLERTVRLLQSCRAITETDSLRAREKLLEMPRSLRFPARGPPPTGCAYAVPPCWPPRGSRSPTGAGHPRGA
ncbi:hypothetical protein GCM10023238_03030 [Streptomyces heliomycini]